MTRQTPHLPLDRAELLAAVSRAVAESVGSDEGSDLVVEVLLEVASGARRDGPWRQVPRLDAAVVDAGLRASFQVLAATLSGTGEQQGRDLGARLVEIMLTTQRILLQASVTDESHSLVDRLLSAEAAELSVLCSDAERAGLAPERVGWAIALDEDRDHPRLHQVVQAVSEGDTPVFASSIRSEPACHVVMLMPESSEGWGERARQVEDQIAALGVRHLVARSTASLVRVTRITRRFCESLRFAQLRHGNGAAIDAASVARFGALDRLPVLERVHAFSAVLGRLVESEKSSLFHLLDALVYTGNFADAERLAGYPRRSASRHVGEVGRITGYQWRDPAHRQEIAFAISLRWLAALTPHDYAPQLWGPYPAAPILRRAQ